MNLDEYTRGSTPYLYYVNKIHFARTNIGRESEVPCEVCICSSLLRLLAEK